MRLGTHSSLQPNVQITGRPISTASCSFRTIAAKKEYDLSPKSGKGTLLVCYLAIHYDCRGFLYLFYNLHSYTLSHIPFHSSIDVSSETFPWYANAYDLYPGCRFSIWYNTDVEKYCCNSSDITNRTNSARSSDFVADLG